MVFGGTSVGANGGPADSCGGCNEMDSQYIYIIYIYVYSIFRIAKPSHVAVQNSHDPWPPSAPRSFAPEGADPAFAEQPTTLPAAVANSQHPSSA